MSIARKLATGPPSELLNDSWQRQQVRIAQIELFLTLIQLLLPSFCILT